MKNTVKVVIGLSLLVFGIGLVSCSDNAESAVINIAPVAARDTTATTDSLTPEEVKLLYKMRTADNRISSEELTKLTESVIGILDEKTGLKSETGRKVGSMSALVSEKSKAVALKSGVDSEIEIPDTLAYVVNFEDSLGFAILAADTRVEQPVLGFVDNGSLMDSTDNPGIAIFLERLEDYMLNSITETEELKDSLLNGILDKLETESGTKASVAEIRMIGTPVFGKTLAHITPLLPVEWGQRAPYNNKVGGKCPNNNGGYDPHLTGCVATATAQIMVYWKYPAKMDNDSFNWTEIRKYTTRPNFYPNAGTISIKKIPANTQNQIAVLFQKIGKGVGMDYGCEGSSAYTKNAVSFLKKLGYKSEGLKDFTPHIVTTSLDEKRPLLAEGCAIKKNHKILGITYNTTYDKCHSWVIDGYLTKELKYRAQIGMSIYNVVSSASYFHHNWGWNGGDNGYYASGIFNTNIDPDFASNTKSGEPYNYQYKVKVVPNIYK